MTQDQGPKDNVAAHPIVRPLGRTRIELVPRDSRSVFVYWEVAAPAEDASSNSFVIELRRERDGEVAASFTTLEKLDGERVEVEPGGRYWAALNLETEQGLQRLARSTSSAGPLPGQEPVTFIEMAPGQSSRPADAAPKGSIDWTARKTDASSR